MKKEDTKKVVRENYAKIALRGGSCCGPAKSCCGTGGGAEEISRKIGYSDEEIGAVPEGANLGLGCGNPVGIASLKKGETVLDLGSGGGFDCFLAADRVGSGGKVIGVDMTSGMIEKARANAVKGGYKNVEFRLGEIEDLPLPDSSVDVIISNCVINLSPEKQKVFEETFRVLRPGGRIMVSDIALSKELPAFLKESETAYAGCVAGAVLKDEYIAAVRSAGFKEVEILEETAVPVEGWISDPITEEAIQQLKITKEQAADILGSVLSIKVRATKD